MKKGMIELIAPNDDRTKLYYYELKEKCYDLVFQYQRLEEKNKQEFESFSKRIPSNFSSESEFVFFQMGYCMKKPLLSSGTYGIASGTIMNLATSLKNQDCHTQSKNYFLSLASNHFYYLSKKNVECSAATGYITPDGSTISMSEQANLGFSAHQILARTLLHHYLMSDSQNSEIYLDYLKEYGKNSNSEIFFLLLSNYLYPYALDDFKTEFSEELFEELRPLQEKLIKQYSSLPEINLDAIMSEQKKSFQKMLKARK